VLRAEFRQVGSSAVGSVHGGGELELGDIGEQGSPGVGLGSSVITGQCEVWRGRVVFAARSAVISTHRTHAR